MEKIKIDKATDTQLNYAAAVAQGWKKREFKTRAPMWSENGSPKCWDDYEPITDQAQCGELKAKYKISDDYCGLGWQARIDISSFGVQKKAESGYCITWMIADVKAFLWSKNPDGMIEVE